MRYMASEIFKRGFLILSNKDLNKWETTYAQIEILNELSSKSISARKIK
jgi:hypothetical protein